MESLEGLWEKFSLLDDEENGIECTKKDAPANFILAAKFLTKRIMNVESVARTFQPLWKSKKDVQIKDMGENILFFHFEDECDLDKVIKHEPWTYNKRLVIFEKVIANVPISTLAFQFTSFWIQIHNLPIHCLNPWNRKLIGHHSPYDKLGKQWGKRKLSKGLSSNLYYKTSSLQNLVWRLSH